MNLVERFIHKYGRLPTEFDEDYLEMLQMSKYRILAIPDFKPGKCANCGSSKEDGRKYIDFGLEIDWYGIVYICGMCLIDIATEGGLFDGLKEEIERLTNTLLKIHSEQARGESLRDDFLKIFEEVRNYITTLPTISNDPLVNSDDSDPESATVKTELTADTIKQAANAAKSGTPKSTAKSRSTNVPSLADLLNTK